MADFLVIQAARFGDLVQTARLALSLEKSGTVHIALDKSLAALAALLYPRAIVHPLAAHGAPDAEGMRHNRKIFARLREINFAKIYNCNYSPLTAAICRLFQWDRIVGYRPAHGFSGGIERAPWCRLAFRLGGMRAASPLNLVDFWAFFAPSPACPADVNPPAKGGGGGIGISIAGREARRSLPPPTLAKIVQIAFRVLEGPRIRLLGGPGELAAARRLLRFLPAQIQEKTGNLCGKTDLPGLRAALEGLDLLITPDTGIMHLAASLGVPVMAFFLSSAWCHETGPYGEGHIVWQSATACSPCLETRPCPSGLACLGAYNDDSFSRCLAIALARGNFAAMRLPAGLQCWRTDLDGFGAICRPLAGEDAEAARRAALRGMLREWTGPRENEAGPAPALARELFPDAEWMLPPERYC